MRVESIAFSADGTPETVTMTMAVSDAALLAKHVGSLAPASMDPDINRATEKLYNLLVGMVFNPYYEDGVADYLLERRVMGDGA